MEKMVALRSVYQSAWSRSYLSTAVTQHLLRHYSAARSLFNFSSSPRPSSPPPRDALAFSGTISSLH
ncbi:hypothetical protein TIFTF001_005160 [Ficus carica]|uniref:Uncharacterized protein n=1 Tax=Ficus carica TaxID=3494 RepID=A0AA87ZE20_FICCA|nr:hypothetical protein TIFTF001_005160 [Ficus carica]